MALLAYNKTTSALTLAAGNPAPVLPASSAGGTRGPAVNVTSELRGLSGANYTSLQVQVTAGDVDFEWTADAEYSTTGLTVGGTDPGPHKASHATGGADALAVASTTATNNSTTPTNQVATATNQVATATNQAATATNNSTTPTNQVATATNQAATATNNNATATNQAATATNQAATATNNNATATNQAETRSNHVAYLDVATADTTTFVATVAIANGALTVAAQPDIPRKIQVQIVDADSSVTAGTVDLVGIGPSGEAVSESVSLTGGSATKTTTKAYATITSATVAGQVGAGGGDTVSLGPATALGLTGQKTPLGTTFAVYKAAVNGVHEAAGTVDATAGTIVPTTAPNGTNDYDFWYNFNVTVVQDAHTHTQAAHNHTQDAHNHVQDAHTHTQVAHNHTQDAHNHIQDSHTHTQVAHNHVQDAHNHTQDAHNHVQDAHTHTQVGHAHNLT